MTRSYVIKRAGGWVMDPLSEEPREFRFHPIAFRWVELSQYRDATILLKPWKGKYHESTDND